jgi:hypothetical protein
MIQNMNNLDNVSMHMSQSFNTIHVKKSSKIK